MATKFGDVMKGVEDFFKKSFNFGHSVEAKVKSDSGVKLTATGKLSGGKVDTKVKASASLFGGFALDKLEVSATKQTGDLEVSYADNQVVPGTKFTFKGHDGARGAADADRKPTGKFAFESKQGQVAIDGEVDLTDGPKAKVNVTGTVDRAVVGATVALDTGLYKKDGGFAVTGYDVVVGYLTGATTVAAQTKDRLANAQLGFESKVGGATFVAQASVPTHLGDAAAEKPVALQAGFKTKVDGDSLAVAVAHDGKARFGYDVALRSGAKFSAAAEIDVANIGSDAHRFGTKYAMDF